jgi:endo-1,4-beta-xylanase
VGVALQSGALTPPDTSAIIAQNQFNSLTPEFELKPDIISPREGVFDFTVADRLVDWALENNMEVRGHTLLWHVTTPDYFLQGTRDEIKTRLETYISTVIGHFKDRVKIWDVVNEVVSTDIFRGSEGIGPDRRSNWYEAVGNADYVEWAFLAARAADPDAILFLNDYETDNPIKQVWLLEILERLRTKNIPIDGVGHQAHLRPETSISEVLGAIDAVDNQFMGLTQHITELDLNAYQDPGTCWESQINCEADIGPVPPDALLSEQALKMRELFDGLEMRSSVTSVTTWGVIDSDSWLNRTPITRFNYPLFFDREGEPKPAFYAITNPSFEI